jgi:predicted nucleic acid-binding protein
VDVVFLDANVLFSAAYKAGAGLRRFWEVADVELVTSAYAAEEARSNLRDADQRHRLRFLLALVRVVEDFADLPLPPEVELPPKDRPILVAAIRAGASHLVTGDVMHFGRYFGTRIAGVRVQKPADFLAGRALLPGAGESDAG